MYDDLNRCICVPVVPPDLLGLLPYVNDVPDPLPLPAALLVSLLADETGLATVRVKAAELIEGRSIY